MTSKINDLLENPILEDASFAQNCNITFPTKESSARCWMIDLGFAYCPVKNSCTLHVHEREDARKERRI